MSEEPLSFHEQLVLEQLLAAGGHSSTGSIEHSLRQHGRDRIRAAWERLVARGLVLTGEETTRSKKARPVYWVSLADREQAEARVARGEPFVLGPRSRLSPLAKRTRLPRRLASTL